MADALASGLARNLTEAFAQLNPSEQNVLRERWGRSLDELISLSNERDVTIFHHGLLEVGHRLEDADQLELASVVYSYIVASPSPFWGEGARGADEGIAPAGILARAQSRLNAMNGVGDWRTRLAFNLERLPTNATRWDMLFAMGGAGLVFRGVRLAATARWASSFESAFGLNAVATSSAFLAETAAFTSFGRLFGTLAGNHYDWSAEGTFNEWAGGAAMLLGLKAMGGIFGNLSERWVAGENSLARITRAVAPQAGMFSGIILGNRLAEFGGFHPERHGDTWLTDGLTTLLEFNIAGRLQRSAGGPALASFEGRMEAYHRAWNLSEFQLLPRFSEIFSPELAMPQGWRLSLPDTMMMSSENGAGDPCHANRATPRAEPEDSRRSRALANIQRQIAETPILPEEEIQELVRRVQVGDRSAEDALVRAHMRYLNQQARRYGIRGKEEVLELIQEGSQGLLVAAKRFDFTRGNRFLTYATWWIRQAQNKYLSDNWRQIRLPSYQNDLLRQIRREMREAALHGIDIDHDVIAEKLELSPTEVQSQLELEGRSTPISLDGPVGERENLHDLLASENPLPSELLVGTGLRRAVDKFLSRSDFVERTVLENALLGHDRTSFAELSLSLGVSQSQLKNLELRGLRRLRQELALMGISGSDAFLEPGIPRLNGARHSSAPPPASHILQSFYLRSRFSGIRAPLQLSPSIAVVGFGMAGVGFTHAMRHYGRFTDTALPFTPRITVFEGMNRVGGKVAPDNMGAQFVDSSHFYPVDQMIADFGLKTTAPRVDYDLAPYRIGNAQRGFIELSGERFARALQDLRRAAREALRRASWEELDRKGAVDFIQALHIHGRLGAEETEAMISRLGFEEGTQNISALSFAINLARSKTPMDRYEVVGGMSRIPEAEHAALLERGAEVFLGTPVRAIHVMSEGVRIVFEREGHLEERSFDQAVLALAPEHFSGVEITGSQMPWKRMRELSPAHITKTHLKSASSRLPEEQGSREFAMWLSGEEATFFHGYREGRALSAEEMARYAFGAEARLDDIRIRSQTWNGSLLEGGIPHAYTTMPTPGQGLEIVRFALEQYFVGRYDAEPLKFANHVTGLGCYVRDAALAGEWSAVAMLRSLGFDVSKAYQRKISPRREMLGIDSNPR